MTTNVEDQNQVLDRFEKFGFAVEDTGGGCQWLRLQIKDNLSFVITDGEAGLPDLTAQLFLMTAEHGDPLMKSELMSSYQLLDLLFQSGL